jgi:Mg2+ and Co2+ transporter CorA
MSNVSIDQLADAITEAVREYTEDVSAAIERKVDEVADLVLEEVKSNHPYTDRSGEYTKGFVKTKQDEYGRTRRVIWNKKHYRRVHLLEFGHAKRGGGRVPAYPHLRPAYEKYAADLPEEIKRIIKKGG